MSIGTWTIFHKLYNETEVRSVVPIGGGVYALWVNYKTGKWGCFYVGAADNLERRLLDHLTDEEPNDCIKGNVKYRCGFHWMRITKESERSGAEKYLYDAMKPECNKDDPGGRPLRIPLPPTPPPTKQTN